MAEKDRKPGQNGKGSGSRVSDTKRYQSNWSEINWQNEIKLVKSPKQRKVIND